MNRVRFALGILLLATSVLWTFESVFSHLNSSNFQSPTVIITIGNFLGIVAALVLLVSVKKNYLAKINWRFELAAGVLLLISAVVVTIPYGIAISEMDGNRPAYAAANAFNLAGIFTFLAATILILFFAKTARPLGLERLEGLTFGALFMLGSLLSLAGYTGLSLDIFLMSNVIALILQLAAMLAYLYPYVRFKS